MNHYERHTSLSFLYMVLFKYICFVLAIVATGLYINNIIVDLTRIFTWENTIHTGEDAEQSKEDSANFAGFRFILSIIMGLTWGVVFIF